MIGYWFEINFSFDEAFTAINSFPSKTSQIGGKTLIHTSKKLNEFQVGYTRKDPHSGS